MQQAELRLFGMIPVKTVLLTDARPVSVYVGGEPFGIRMLTEGVMVVSLGSVPTAEGTVRPAEDAGIEVSFYNVNTADQMAWWKPYSSRIIACTDYPKALLSLLSAR